MASGCVSPVTAAPKKTGENSNRETSCATTVVEGDGSLSIFLERLPE
jgi:hypothetical protein